MNRRKVDAALLRLNHVLPLARSCASLDPALRRRYREFLRGWYDHGAPPPLAPADVAALTAAALVVADDAGAVSGAYPFTTGNREHVVATPRSSLNCMCSIDALAVSTLFGEAVTIRSRCRASGADIALDQQGLRVQVQEPVDEVYAAIDWAAADPGRTCAASLCTEMVFLAGQRTAIDWENACPDSRQVFDLDDAATFAAGFFQPLLAD